MHEYDVRVDAAKKFLERGWILVDGEYRRRPMAGIWTTIAPLGHHFFEIVVERDDEFQNKTLVRRKRRCRNLLDAKATAWDYVEPRLAFQ